MAKIGICFSGGIAKGAYQIGFCKAFLEYLIADDISVISASSIGAWNAVALLTDNINLALELWVNNNAHSIRKIIYALTRRVFLVNKLDMLVKDDTKIEKDFYITCCEFPLMITNHYNVKGWEPDDIKKILHAAVTIPTLMEPIKFKDKSLFDGAVRENIPISPLTLKDLDLIFIVHFDPMWTHDFGEDAKKIVNLCFVNDKQVVKDSFDFKKESITNMIEKGYSQTKKLFEILFKNGIDDLEYIYYVNEFVNKNKVDSFRLINGDYIINKINGLSNKAENIVRKIIRK